MAWIPNYQCHKQVFAVKIAAIEINQNGSAKIAPSEPQYPTIYTKDGYGPRFKGGEEDLGYYVLYTDDYESWSPTKAFEEGYTRL